MSKIELSKEKIVAILEVRNPTSLSQIYRCLGGSGSVSGSTAKRLKMLVPDIMERLAGNKAVPVKSERAPKSEATRHPNGKPMKASKAKVPHHSQNPFRPNSGYALLINLVANAGSKGIGKEDLLKAYCKATGKDLVHAKYGLSVINSGEAGRTRHRSMKDNITIIRESDNYQVCFD